MSRELFFRILGGVLVLCLGVPCQLLINSEAVDFWGAMAQTPMAWLLYLLVGFSISEYIYNYLGRRKGN
ncbi:hypothetical protein [Catenovulum sediminis]|uniref:Uncharacterized protein n=1 Tax=Catenovulum sediminis TaxID=1740262 RepID=A0ABV1RJF6_9ALTE